jgi:hypothetical protein
MTPTTSQRLGAECPGTALLLATVVSTGITAAYWFTASTSVANPAVTLARSVTNTFAGIAPANVPGFIMAQMAEAAAVVAGPSWLVLE